MSESERTAALEQAAIAVDGGLATAAVAAIGAVPPGPRRDLEFAVWTRRIAEQSDCSAYVIPPDVTDEQALIIAELIIRVRIELGGGL